MSDWPAIGFSDALARSTRCGYRSRRSSCKRAEAARNAVLAIIAVQVHGASFLNSRSSADRPSRVHQFPGLLRALSLSPI